MGHYIGPNGEVYMYGTLYKPKWEFLHEWDIINPNSYGLRD